MFTAARPLHIQGAQVSFFSKGFFRVKKNPQKIHPRGSGELRVGEGFSEKDMGHMGGLEGRLFLGAALQPS
jgi:hypothetical protein